MADDNSKNISYPSQLAIFLALTGGGILVASMASLAIWNFMTGQPFPLHTEDILQPKFYAVNMVLQVVSTFFIFFMPAHFFGLICYKNPYNFLGYNKRINTRQIILVITILLLTFPLSGALANLNNILPIPKNLAIKFKAMEAARAAEEAALIHITSFSKYIISLFVIALLPAVFEETFFRGSMQNLFTRWFKNPWVAILFTSIIFSLIHLSYYGFLVRFALGIILGFIFYYSGSLWLNILLHFLFNGVQVTALYVITIQGVKDKGDIENNFPLWMGIIALAALFYLFKEFKKISFLQQAKHIPPDDTAGFDFNNHVSGIK